MRQTVIISDLHLSVHRPELIQAFESFTKRLADDTDLIIAGDFFDFFVGINKNDVMITRLQGIIQSLVKRKVNIKFQCGNRDYLVDKNACRFLSMTLLPDEYLLDTPQGKALLIHGDLLCLHDQGLKRFRKLCHNRLALGLFRLLPFFIRNYIGSAIRSKSAQAEAYRNITPEDELVIKKEAEILALKQQCRILIHGHFHIFGCHRDPASGIIMRLSLGGWGKKYSYVYISDKTIELIERPIDELLNN